MCSLWPVVPGRDDIAASKRRRKVIVSEREITEKDRKMARMCLECKVCAHAREKQRGIIYWFVKKIEGSVCPYCKAYERVYGRKAHEPIPS